MGETDGPTQDAHRLAPAAPDEQTVYGSCSPGWHSAGEHTVCVHQWIEDVRSAGIERVCCLLPGSQLDAEGANLTLYREAFGRKRVLHAPVPDHHLVDEAVLTAEILPFLDSASAAGESVVVHCLAVIGRTGQVLAAWLVYDREYHPKQAIETVREFGRDPYDAVHHDNATRSELYALLEAAGED
jgi:protein-tyrosine phosphatase